MSRLFISSLLLIGTVSGSSLLAATLTLDEAIHLFLNESPYISAESYRVEEAERAANSAFGRLLPVVNLNASHIQSVDEPLFGNNQRTQEYSLILRQIIFAGGGSYYNWRANQYLSDSTKAGAASVIQGLKLELIQAYLAVLTQAEILKHQQEQVAVLKNQLQVVKTRFEAGSAILSDVRQAEARLAASEGAAALGQSQYDQAKANFQRLLGLGEDRQLSWPTPPQDLPENAEALFSYALQKNPSIHAANFNIDQQKSLESAARSKYLPELAAEIRLRDRHEESERLQRQEFVLDLKMNLFNGLQSHHDLARSRIAVRRSMEEQEIVKRRLKRDSEEVFALFKAARSNLNSLEIAVKSAEEATRAFQIEYKSGSRSLSDLLNAEEDLLQSRIGLAQARFNYVLSAFRIKWVEGSL